MGERKGTNLYYPPDYDPKKGGINKFQGTHALRERARKLHLGILIIRFEMPFNMWCEGCGNHIGMGVRYNAEKKKIGMYYSTPVYQFRMKCHLCDNYIEIKTDPGNLEYIIVSGGRRQENRWDPKQNEQIVPEDKDTSKKLFDDAMFKLEHGHVDMATSKQIKPGLVKLMQRNEDVWRDDFALNQALRHSFRADKKKRKAEELQKGSIIKRNGLNIELLPEHPDDIKMASLLALAPAKSINERTDETRMDIMNRSSLPTSSGCPTTFTGLRTTKVLKETSLDRKKMGVLIKTKTQLQQPSLVCDYSSSSSDGG